MNPKKRKTSVWTIVFIVIALLSIGFLLYNYFFSASQSLSLDAWISKLPTTLNNAKINIYVPTSSVRGVWATYTNMNGASFATFYGGTFSEFAEALSETLNINSLSHQSALPTNPLSYLFSLIGVLFPLLFLGLMAWIYLPMMRGGKGRFGAMGGEFSGTRLVRSKIRFTDVAGIAEEKKELLEVVDFLKYSQKYLKMGARIPKGLLLYGPPGTGKTLLAKAVSGEAAVPFFSVAGSEFEEVFVGMGASRVREMFKKAKEKAPCIIFIDEIDSLGGNRSRIGAGVKDQTLNQFLSEMDGFETNEGVIVIAATNRADVLDPALLRSGRFDRKIQINLPDVKEREAILKIHSRNKKIAKNISFKQIAERTPGFSGAQLENSLNEAALYAVRHNKTIIESKDLDEGIDRVIGGPSKNQRVINEKTRLIVALHEAGHAMIGLILGDAMQVQKITIIPRGSAGGYTITTPKDETLINSKEALYHRITGLLGGRAAEETKLGTWGITTGGHDDFSKATQLAVRMVEEFGMSDFGVRFSPSQAQRFMATGNISEEKKAEQDKEINNILEYCYTWAKKIIVEHLNLLHLLAEALLILETINAEQIEYIYKNNKLPQIALQKKEKYPDKKYLDLSLIQKKNKPDK